MHRKNTLSVYCLALVAFVLALLVLATGLAGAEGGNGKTKTTEIPAAFNADFIICSGDFSSMGLADYGIRLNDERATDGTITLSEGDNEYDGVIRLVKDEDGAINRSFHPEFSKSGTPVYQVHLESDNYYTDFEYQCRLIALADDDLGLSGRVIRFPLNQVVQYDDLVSLGLFIDKQGVMQNFVVRDYPEYDFSSDREEYTLSYKEKTILFKKPGQYCMLIGISVNNCQEINFPFIAVVDEQNEQLSISGESIGCQYGHADALFTDVGAVVAAAELYDLTGAREAASENNAGGSESDAENLLADAFAMADEAREEPEENGDNNNDVLESLAKESDNTTVDTKSMTEEDALVIMAEMIKEATKGVETSAQITGVFDDKETKLCEKGVFKWGIPAGFTMAESNTEKVEGANNPAEQYTVSYADESGLYSIGCYIYNMLDVLYKQDFEATMQYYDKVANKYKSQYGVDLLFEEVIELDGDHPAFVIGTHASVMNGKFQAVSLITVRAAYLRGNNSLFVMTFTIKSEPGTVYTTDSMPTLEQFMPLISQISYVVPEDREAAGVPEGLITEKDMSYHVEIEPDSRFISAGQVVKIKADYDKPELMKPSDGLQFYYTAFLTEPLLQGIEERVDDSMVHIDWQGNMKAGPVTESLDITVEITSAMYPEIKYYRFVVLPAVTKVELNEKQLTLYTDQQEPFVFQGSASPENAWMWDENGESNFVWSCDKEDILSVTDNKDRTASIQPWKAGKVNVTLTDTLSKKKAVLKVNVLESVTGVILEGPDTVASGKKVSYKVSIEPKNAGNKKVHWRLDVDESVAKISGNGQVSVMKDVPAGTIITVYCEAEGAAQPVIASKVIMIE